MFSGGRESALGTNGFMGNEIGALPTLLVAKTKISQKTYIHAGKYKHTSTYATIRDL